MGEVACQPIWIDLTITLETAVHIGTGMGLGQILDELTVQGPHPDVHAKGHDRSSLLPYVPGSSLKGRVRHHTRQVCAVLVADADIRRQIEANLFGFAYQTGGLVFRDAYLKDEELARTLAADRQLTSLLARTERSFVSVSPQRRVALEQRLFRLELADHGLVFRTQIVGVLPADQGERDLALLLLALREMTHLGGHKGRGLGKCRIDIDMVKRDTQSVDWKEVVCTLEHTT